MAASQPVDNAGPITRLFALGEDLIHLANLMEHRRATGDSERLRQELRAARAEIARLEAAIKERQRVLAAPALEAEERKPDVAALDAWQRIVSRLASRKRQLLDDIRGLEEDLAQEQRNDSRARLIEALRSLAPLACAHCKENVLDADPCGFPEAFLEQQPLRVVYPMKTATEHVSDAPNLCEAKEASQPYFALKSPGVKWANEHRTHGLAFAPSHYGAVDGSHIKWERTGFSAYQRNRCYDLFCREQDKWFYSGVYEVVGLRTMRMDQFRAQNPDMANGIICNTAAVEGHLSELVTGFYEQGLLEVECIAIRRVKFKRSVYESMVERRKGLEARARGARIASDVRRQGEGTKRGLEQPDEGEPTENNAPAKKAKMGRLPALLDNSGGQAFRGIRTRRGSLVIYEGSRSRR